ncbi:MAG TPA: hydrogenase maturation protease [Candidatus Nanopelagicaceae bacterium]|nr:hydrogenase maturation protease [Candidatus Nanopelagicaceae bacterium]
MFSYTIYHLAMENLYEKLLKRLIGVKNIVFMGIGEEKLSDDGVGPYIISELLDYSSKKILFINAGTDPMARIDDVVTFKPTYLILIDTCTVIKPPGMVTILERESIKEYVPISTHTIPVHIVIDLIVEKLPELNVFMIGFVPESLEGFKELKLYKQDVFTLEERSNNIDLPFFEINLTKTLKTEADRLIEIIKKIIDSI